MDDTVPLRDDVFTADILPDCRTRTAGTPINAKWHSTYGWMTPVFCANCGADGGLVPSEAPFIFYLCNVCFTTHGVPAGTMVMPDEVWWEKLKREQLEAHGRLLTPDELATEVAAAASPLATLIREGR